MHPLADFAGRDVDDVSLEEKVDWFDSMMSSNLDLEPTPVQSSAGSLSSHSFPKSNEVSLASRGKVTPKRNDLKRMCELSPVSQRKRRETNAKSNLKRSEKRKLLSQSRRLVNGQPEANSDHVKEQWRKASKRYRKRKAMDAFVAKRENRPSVVRGDADSDT